MLYGPRMNPHTMTNLKPLAQKDLSCPVLSPGQAIRYAFSYTFVNVYKILDEI